ncbi:S-methyl-5-thioribose-1-phosphate isomerase [Yinghuangia sp. ASG 101]|uniref:S-methyl-5-thioribose-1-phosphate isomerase n=1 Tax=Yinghuangia sp. ASG 101 TaxID=2896848 RepID=UPI001E4E78D3|nr:S-methyl-5-thioribose-1-phosphate isomerase [Yinghuangia sp. ASG 101]UGQ09558.1 S-methyl-5-thioribose-1-phosphate isomerase [Yinghuangia sp. ASG 101]
MDNVLSPGNDSPDDEWSPHPAYWVDDVPTAYGHGPAVVLLDQTRLPAEEVRLVCSDVPTLVDAVRRLVVRGAPLLGVVGAYGVALAAARGDDVRAAAEAVAHARPTAVNLAWGARRALAAWEASGGDVAATLREARAVHEEDARASEAMAAHGARFASGLGEPDRPLRVLTHCNTGALVSGGVGTALAVVRDLHRAGRLGRLWVDETRPLLQGARLTAYEAARMGMPYAVLPDSAAGSLFAAGDVDLVVVGADRIAADGATANKVGTYPLAVLARHHGVPFVVVAPLSTVDPGTPGGADIVVEQRDECEVTELSGVPLAPVGSRAYNPAFDVTPPELITAIVTESGVLSPVNAIAIARMSAGHDPVMRR